MKNGRLSFPQNGTLQAHLSAIVESSDDAIISKDLNGIILSWNRGAERIFGYTAEEAVGQPISMLAVPDRKDEYLSILDRISRGQRIDHFATKRRTKDGRILSISLTVSPIRDASGAIVAASKIARDITDQVQHQRALEEANRLLTRANADLEQFAYSASHDLQEPLRMISTYSEMLARKFPRQLDDSADQYIDYILMGVTRMDQLLKDLRTFTQASIAGKDAVRDVSAAEALERALKDLKVIIEESGAIITHERLPRVRVHEFHMEQLFQNLIGNAIRYRSLEAPKIHIAAQPSGDQWKFSVRDNGIGIDPEYREQIFGMFKRLHSYTEYPGTGMGLAICQRIVDRAGGHIWVESEPGRGSTFLFTLPAATTG
jgi:PAS domain S-box-containing protein